MLHVIPFARCERSGGNLAQDSDLGARVAYEKCLQCGYDTAGVPEEPRTPTCRNPHCDRPQHQPDAELARRRRDRQIATALRQGVAHKVVETQFGVSRRTAYRVSSEAKP